MKCKKELLAQLIDEQFGLCCYSEVALEIERFGSHIEHVVPKSFEPRRTFDYTNLAACALAADELPNHPVHERFGGHKRLSHHDSKLFVSPFEPDCSRYFAYLSDGRVVPGIALDEAEKARAEYTIGLLGLNVAPLVNRRRACAELHNRLIDEHTDCDWDLNDLAAVCLGPTCTPAGNRLEPHISVIRACFG